MNGTTRQFLDHFRSWKIDRAVDQEELGPTPRLMDWSDPDHTTLELLAWAAELLAEADHDQELLGEIIQGLHNPELNGTEELEWLDATIARARLRRSQDSIT